MRKNFFNMGLGGRVQIRHCTPPPPVYGPGCSKLSFTVDITCNYNPSKIISKTRGVTGWSMVETRDGKRFQVCFRNIQSLFTFERIVLQEFEILVYFKIIFSA